MSSAFQIAGRSVGGDAPCYVIGEIGINHDGEEGLAAAMIDALAAAGADAAKLQTVDVSESYMPGTASHAEFSKRVLPSGALARLALRARERGIQLFTTPADFPSLAAVIEAQLPAIKISSGLLTHVPLVRAAARAGVPLIMSTGLADLDEVIAAVNNARHAGARNIAVLHAVSLYPAPAAALNLRALDVLAERLECVVGYSDHHDGAAASVAAVARGAKVIEKHFTLDRRRPGADHAISLEPDGFLAFVGAIREVETMLGAPGKAANPEEYAPRAAMRRVLVARGDLRAGTVIDDTAVRFMRVTPREGTISVDRWDEVQGRRLVVAVPDGACLTLEQMGERG